MRERGGDERKGKGWEKGEGMRERGGDERKGKG